MKICISGDSVSWESRKDLPYTMAVLREIQRLQHQLREAAKNKYIFSGPATKRLGGKGLATKQKYFFFFCGFPYLDYDIDAME